MYTLFSLNKSESSETSKEMFIRADANRDGNITIRDVTQIQRYLSNYIDKL